MTITFGDPTVYIRDTRPRPPRLFVRFTINRYGTWLYLLRFKANSHLDWQREIGTRWPWYNLIT